MRNNTTYKQYILHTALFLLTLVTTTLAGAEWTGKHYLNGWDFVWSGLDYSITFLGILTIHEMGHYYFSRKNNVDATLPYYIPFYFPGIPSIGTFGAFIRMKGIIHSRRTMFDIGIAGPLAGFVAAILLLVYGFATLPEKSYLFRIHPEYAAIQGDYRHEAYTYDFIKKRSDLHTELTFIQDSIYYLQHHDSIPELKKPVKAYETEFEVIVVGKNLLFLLFEKLFSYQGDRLPDPHELYHYPFIFAGYLALFFTALNLIPVGQLDGGHVTYGLFGYERSKKISAVFFILFVSIAGVGMFKENILQINFFTANAADQLEFAFFYLIFLYLIFAKMFETFLNALLTAVAVFTFQFLVEFLFPEITGYGFWLLYAFLIGRYLGVYHPPALSEQPLDTKRKVLGWIALGIFVLCFTPEVVSFELIHP
jgi:membrane-associated protease RseP (regulator of RpoE activity)